MNILLTNETLRITSTSCISEAGHLHLVEYFVDKEESINPRNPVNWYMGMYKAAEAGHLHLVEYFVDKIPSTFEVGLENAALRGHLPLVRYLVDKIPLGYDLNRIVKFAEHHEQYHIIDYLQKVQQEL